VDRVNSINDLVVIMDKETNFVEHVDVMVGEAFATLGLIRRLSFEFRDPYTLMSLYTSLVHPKLEYASCVWNPFNDVHVVWVGRIFTICHSMSMDVLFCALTRLWKGDLSPA
jgi:hypothetical protein